MSFYDYECDECGNVQEEMHLMNESPEIKCNDCQSIMSKCISGGTGFILKGDGFYSTGKKFKESMIKKSAKFGKRAQENNKPVNKISDI